MKLLQNMKPAHNKAKPPQGRFRVDLVLMDLVLSPPGSDAPGPEPTGLMLAAAFTLPGFFFLCKLSRVDQSTFNLASLSKILSSLIIYVRT